MSASLLFGEHLVALECVGFHDFASYNPGTMVQSFETPLVFPTCFSRRFLHRCTSFGSVDSIPRPNSKRCTTDSFGRMGLVVLGGSRVDCARYGLLDRQRALVHVGVFVRIVVQILMVST